MRFDESDQQTDPNVQDRFALHQQQLLQTNPMGPITADFVSKAYQRAQQTFDELRRKMNEAQSNWSSPPNRPEVAGFETDAAIEDPFAATDRMMSIAKSHLSEAMKAMVDALDHHPAVTTQKRNHEHNL